MEPTLQHDHHSENHKETLISPEYFPELGTLLLHFPDNFNKDKLGKLAGEHGMIAKDDFHITVIGYTSGQKILESLSRLASPEKLAKTTALKELIKTNNWQLELLPDAYELHSVDYSKKTIKRSIVEMASVEGLEEFIAKINQLLGTDLVAQPPHVTLCTAGSDPEKSKMGIGVANQAILNTFNTGRVDLPPGLTG